METDILKNIKEIYAKTPPKEESKLFTGNARLNNKYVPDEWEPTEKVKKLITRIKVDYAKKLADDTIASFKTEWYKDNKLSPKLVDYLEKIKINDLIWRMRYQSILTGESFMFPFIHKSDTKLFWVALGSDSIIFRQRLIDKYVNVTFFFTPIVGYGETFSIITCIDNKIIYLDLKSDGNTAPIPKDYSGSSLANRFDFYYALVSQKTFNYNHNLLLVHWMNNSLYDDAFIDLEFEIRTLAQVRLAKLEDIMLSGIRIYRFDNEGRQENTYQDSKFIQEKHYYLNHRQMAIQEKVNLASPASIGEYTPTSTASSFDVYLLSESGLMTTIDERLGMFHTLSTKGKAQQHSTEILAQNKNAIVLGKRKVHELKHILVEFLNIVSTIIKDDQPQIEFDKFKFEYQLPYQEVLEMISAIDSTTNKPNVRQGKDMTTDNEKM